MDQIRKRRLLNDLKDIKKNYNTYKITQSDLTLWTINFMFRNKSLTLELKFPETFPNAPPTGRFLCEIFHPNVWSDGKICLDTLSASWVPAMSIAAVITTIKALLDDPNPDSPANTEAAEMFKNDKEKYDLKFDATVEKLPDFE